jgi:hypothetical protein
LKQHSFTALLQNIQPGLEGGGCGIEDGGGGAGDVGGSGKGNEVVVGEGR